MVLTIMASIYAIIDWKKGKRSEVPIAASPVESEPASYQPSGGFGTPDPFMVQSHRNHSVPSSTLGGTDGRNPTSGIILGKDVDAHEHQRHGSVSESLDSAAQMHDMQPTEPNMSSSNLGRGGLVHSMVPPPPHSDGYAGHPLGHVQTNSMGAQSLGLAGSGVVGVGGGPGSAAYAESTRSGKSNHGVVGVPLQPYPPQFQRQESHMSLRSVKSSHSQRSFQRPPPSPVNHGYDTQGVPRHPSTRSTSREYFREPRTNSRMPVHEQQQPPPPNSPLPSPGQAM